jgi:hypothetical protein
MLASSGGANLGRMALDLGQRVRAMLTPLEDVCRYREQLGSDLAIYDVKPASKAAMPFSIAIAPGGVNIEAPAFAVRELPLTESAIAAAFVEALLAGRVRRVTGLAANGRPLTIKTFVFDAAGRPLYKHRSRTGLLAGFSRAASYRRERFAPYRG